MLWEKWKMNKRQLVILFCIGILLIIIAIPAEQQADGLEGRLEKILSQIEKIGEVHVMITTDENKEVQGIAVAAEGGDKAVVAKEIVEVLRALFDIETHKIKVIKGGS